jgi:hypothetical protein
LIVLNVTQEALYTFSRNKGFHDNGGGSGWSSEGIRRYKELYKAVKKDRKTRQTATFNQELLKMFQARRKRESGRGLAAQMKSQAENSKQAYRCINELNDSSSDDDDDDDDDHDEDEVDEVIYKGPITNPFVEVSTGYNLTVRNETQV